nr:MAG TPA: hypothetical protein [Caudoviricetes sp.]
MLNLEMRQFRNELVTMINQRRLPIEVKSLIINDIARDVAAQADRTIVYEELTRQEQEKSMETDEEKEESNGN